MLVISGSNGAVGGASGTVGLGIRRLATELLGGRFLPRQSMKLEDIEVEYQLDHETVLKAFAEFQALGVVTLSGNHSAIVRSPNLEETREAYRIRAAIEELGGQTAAAVLRGYTTGLRGQLADMRAAAEAGDLDACAEHDVEFHRDILKASQYGVLLRVWDALAVDLQIRSVMAKAWKHMAEVLESHQLIVEALEKGCGREAGQLLRHHVESSLAYLKSARSDSEPRSNLQENLESPYGHGPQLYSARAHRVGLPPARLRKVIELVHAKIEGDLSTEEMAESAGLSTAHFSQMFRQSTGESPHQFVLRQRVERAKEMLATPGARVIDVAVACGFKTQQHFARVFRRMCGASPSQYRHEFLG